MRHDWLRGGCVVGLGLVLLAGPVVAEEITLTTYYPSPRGVYDQLRAVGDTYLATGGGNVGIGTETPSARLEVAGGGIELNGANVLEFGADAAQEFNANKIGFGVFEAGSLNIVGGGTTGTNRSIRVWDNVAIGTATNDSYSLSTGGALNIGGGNSTIAGNLGLGTASPAQRLDVNGAIAMTDRLFLGSGGGYLRTGDAGGAWIHLEAASSPGLVLNHFSAKPVALATDAGANVGIGLLSPAFKLDVAGTARASDFECSDCIDAGDIGANAVGASELAASGVIAGTYGNTAGTAYPRIAVDGDGRITSASEVTVSGAGGGCAGGRLLQGTNITISDGGVYDPCASSVDRTISAIASGGPTGSGTVNHVARWTGATSLGTGALEDDGANIWLDGSRFLEFGADQAQEFNANKIGFGVFEAGSLNIVGGGTDGGNRSLRIWDNVAIGTATNDSYSLSTGSAINIGGGNSFIAGNLGVGDSSPDAGARLDVEGIVRFDYGTGNMEFNDVGVRVFNPEGWVGEVRLGAPYGEPGVWSSSTLNLIAGPSSARLILNTDGTVRGATYGFGGMYYQSGTGSCGTPNVFTGACSCPGGFSSYHLFWHTQNSTQYSVRYCYR